MKGDTLPGRSWPLLAGLLFGPICLAGCSSAPPDGSGGSSAANPGAAYACADTTFSATFVGDSAIVVLGDRSWTLPRAISASGARYSDGQVTFWEHQGAASLELPGTRWSDCPMV